MIVSLPREKLSRSFRPSEIPPGDGCPSLWIGDGWRGFLFVTLSLPATGPESDCCETIIPARVFNPLAAEILRSSPAKVDVILDDQDGDLEIVYFDDDGRRRSAIIPSVAGEYR